MRFFRIGAWLLLAACALVMVAEPPIVTSLRHAVFDGYQRIFPRTRLSEPAVIVEIDERSLAAIGQWPWPRVRLAELIDRIAQNRPAAIGLDLLFPEPDRFSPAAMALSLPVMPTDMAEKLRAFPSGDAVFAKAMRDRNVVLGIAGTEAIDPRFPAPPKVAPMRFSTSRDLPLRRFAGHLQSLAELDAAAAGRGLLSGAAQDGIVRRAPLFARVQDVVALSFGLEMLRVASAGNVVVTDRGPGSINVGLAELSMPAQDDGTIWLRYTPHDAQRFVSALDVLGGTVPREKLENKLVLIGITGLGLLDHQVTVLRESVPGVEIHAQLIEQLFDNAYLERPANALWLELALMLTAGALAIVLLPNYKVQWAIALLAGGLTIWLALGAAAFLWRGILLDVAWPALSTLAVFGVVLAGSLAESDRMRRILREHAAHMAGELDAARRIQMGLLPNPAEVFAGDARFTVAAALEPARRVGGDFYDCFMLDRQRMFFVVADVSGKGLPAALFMAAAKSHLKSAALLHPGDISGIVFSAQAEIGRENPEQMFITLFAGILHADSGRLEYVNAGHDAPYARKPAAATVRLEQAGGPPLCVMEGFQYPGGTRNLAPGEWLCVMTDGVTEATDAKGGFFGGERVKALLEDAPALQWPGEVVNRIRASVHAFASGTEPADDMTLLVVRWNGPAAGMGA
ncbi:MAG: CHASE2 domain-containing protein [Betaproteobacteria bacterium]